MRVEDETLNVYMGWSPSRLAKLSEPVRGVIRLLMAANLNPLLDAVEFEEWGAWWGQEPANRVWDTIVPRGFVRSLDQGTRSLVEVGLDGMILRSRPSHDAPLVDVGILGRLATMGWKNGLGSALEKLGELPASVATPLWSAAFSHAVSCRGATGSAHLVRWAQEQGWTSQSLAVEPKILATAWTLWINANTDKWSDFELDDMLLDQSMSLSEMRPGEDSEKEFWKTVVVHTDRSAAGEALSAWCGRYPGAWERMHHQALEDDLLPNAWLLACEYALKEGVDCSLWLTALNSPSTQSWLKRMDWSKDHKASPLSSWWKHWVSLERRLEHGTDRTLPGLDPVSQSLRHIGAIEPGSDEEKRMGARSFAALLNYKEAHPSWFKDRPEWVYNDPITNANPIFNSNSWSEVEHWMALGFDAAAVNHKGENALARYINKNRYRRPVRLSVYLSQAFRSGLLPTTGNSDGQPMIAHIAALQSEEVCLEWMRARSVSSDLSSPAETRALCEGSSAHAVLGWVRQLEARSEWTSDHACALWCGLVHRDLQEDKEAWDDVMGMVPFEESAQSPLWAQVWRETPDPPDYMQAHSFVVKCGGVASDAGHPCWETPEVAMAFVGAMASVSAKEARILTPENANHAWWISMLSVLLGSPDRVAHAETMTRWIEGGLPLDGEVLEFLRNPPGAAGRALNGTGASLGRASPWWEAPALVVALAQEKLQAITPIVARTQVRRF